MRRRTFLASSGGLIAGVALQALLPRIGARATTLTRAQAWAPNPAPLLALEWRYIAGRITSGPDDYGFIVSISDHHLPSPAQELLIERQDFNTGASQSFAYPGSFSYAAATGSYTFTAAAAPVSATLLLDPNTQLYHVTVAAPTLSLADIVLRPQGDLIPESGDGLLSVGSAQGLSVASDYYADWTEIEIGGKSVGVARVDMQGLRLAAQASASPAASTDFHHHWFAVAGMIQAQPIWLTAWRIVSGGAVDWDVTIARGATLSWAIDFQTAASTIAQPLSVRELAWQPTVPLAGSAAPYQTGQAWQLTAGVAQPGDLLDLTLAVPPGQFAASARVSALNVTNFVEEGMGIVAAGSVQGQPISSARLVVAETTAAFALDYLPLLRR